MDFDREGKTRLRIRGTSMEVEVAAKSLRLSMTPAERILWSALRGRQLLGLKFRAQHPMGNFILDFYCPSHRLVIEVDGGVHTDQQEYDHARSQLLAQYGYQELRISNDDIFTSLPSVLERIVAVVSANQSGWPAGK